MTVDWDGLKALKIQAGISFQGPHLYANALIDQFPAILADHERSVRVIAAAEKLIAALENRVSLADMLVARAEFDKAKQS